jgi:tetratricopeptide (TPR) repeat protein
MRVGNGGFSLRSRKLLEALQDPRIELVEAEDVTIGRAQRPLLEREYGIRYADDALADRFAFEAAYPIALPFGFHGLYNFCRVVPEPELADLAATFSDAIARSVQLGQLLRNCVALGQWRAVAAIARRRLAVLPSDTEARALLARAEAAIASGPAVGRNDPCPCGSGKRYKQCHGALGSAPTATPVTTPASGPSANAVQSALPLAQRGVTLHRAGDIDGAERAYREALGIDPNHPLALHYLGVVLFQRMRFAEALPLLERSTAQVPGEPEFHNNLGLALAALDRNDDAVAAYRRTLALAPRHATASNNLGLALQAQNRIADAIVAYRNALQITPDFAHAHWNLALALLAARQYGEGWREYEWRLRLPELGGRAPALPVPRWNGDDLRGKTLLVTTEQGVGDAIQFIRYARTLAARGIRVLVQAPPELALLLATAPGVAATVATGTPLPQCDAEIPMLSIARILDIGGSDIEGSAYLRTDPRHRPSLREPTPGATRRAGLAWAGAPHHPNDRRRSIPVSALAPLFEVPGIDWYSLQKGPREPAITELPAARSIVRLAPDANWLQTAALIDALDVVVTVDTSVAHVAGALGKPVFVMLPYAPDWRWGLADRTPWYASARLFRQPAIADWTSVIQQVAHALQGLDQAP